MSRTTRCQIKATVDSALATDFRSKCAENDETITSALTAFMTSYISAGTKSVARFPDITRRRQRVKEHEHLLRRYQRLLDAEQNSIENMPENFHSTVQYDLSSEIIAALESALEILQEVY